MFWWEQVRDQYLRGQRHQETVERSSFTSEQLASLRVLREQVHARRAAAELDIDERRLQFIRWLIEHGRLGEWTDKAPFDALSHAGHGSPNIHDKYRRR